MKKKSKNRNSSATPIEKKQGNGCHTDVPAESTCPWSNLPTNPWPGLASYQDPSDYKDGRYYKFCGRAAETYELSQLIENRSLVTLYGSTGIGKTSLLRAGVFPLLKQHFDESQHTIEPSKFHPIYVRLGAPGQLAKYSSQDFATTPLAEILIQCIEREIKVETDFTDPIDNNERYLWRYFHTRQFYYQEQRVTPVIVLDQFEEIFSIRENDDKVKLLLKQLYVLVENRLSWRNTEGMHESSYRFVISLREDRFFYLEDFVDTLRLSLFKENRYRLHPMDPDSQAVQVITIPGEDIIDTEHKNEIASNIIEKARNKDRRDVNTLMLSLICSQLFEKKGRLTLEASQNINLTLDSYYQDAIQNLPFHEIHFIEKNFVNGDNRQPVEEKIFKSKAPNAYNRFYKDENSSFKIITDVVVPGKDTNHVELVHDQLAAVINARQKAKDRKWKTALLRMSILALVVLAGLLLVFSGQDTNKKEGQPLSIMRLNGGEYSTTDSLWVGQEELTNDAMVERLRIKNKSKYKIEQCPYLKTIDLSDLGQDTLQLTIKNCDVLKSIILPNRLGSFKLEIENCPKLNLNINKGVGELYIKPMEVVLSFNIDKDVDRYKESEGILWDINDRRVVYYPRAAASDISGQTFSCSFPKGIKTDKLAYGSVTLTNIDYKEVNDNTGHSYSTRYLTSMSQDRIDSWAVSNDKDEAGGYVLPDSLDHIPAGMFKSMIKIDSIVMPQKLNTIESESFYDCQKLHSIILPNSLISIGDRAFYGCLALKHITIPEEVKSIGKQSFEGCASLETVEFLGDNVELGDRAFANCTNLKYVKLPRNPISHAKTDYYSPFYNSGAFNGKEKFSITYNDAIERNEEYELAWNDNNELIVRLSGNSSEIYLPIGYVQNVFHIEPDAHTLNHIHIPWPQPVYVKDGQKYELRFNLSKSDKQHITLHVPYGCKRYYEMNREFTDFRNIVEDPFMQQVTNWIKDIALITQKSISKPISAFLICCFVLLLFLTAMTFQRKWWKMIGLDAPSIWIKSVWRSILFCALTMIVYTLLFWFFNIYCSLNVYLSQVLSAVFALLLSSSYFLASFLISWIERNKDNWMICDNSQKYRHKILSKSKKLILAVIGISCIAFFVYYLSYHTYKSYTYSSALSDSNYEKAISLYADSLIKIGRLNQKDILQLRNLMSLNGDSSQLVLIKREHYDKCDPNYEVPWGVQEEFSFTRNDSIFMFNTSKNNIWGGKDPFNRGNLCRHDAENMIVSYYDTYSDSSVVVALQDVNRTIRIKGKLYETVTGTSFIVSENKDGNKYLYDYNGGFITYDNKISCHRLFDADFFIGEKNGDDLGYAFMHTEAGPVCIILPKGSDLGIYDKRYLIWRTDKGETLAYDTFAPSSNPILIDNNHTFVIKTGEQVTYNQSDYTTNRNREDGSVKITETKTGRSFFLPVRYANIAGTTLHNYYNGRYYMQGDYLYNEFALFDFQNNGRLVAELEGTSCSFLQYPDNAFYTIIDKGLQFYIMEDGEVYKTFMAKNNIRKEYTMESYYHFRGNYLIHDEDCNSDANHYARKVYSLTIPGAKSILLTNQHVFACNDTLIVSNPNEKNFYFYRYETIGEQINRSNCLNDNQKMKLQQFLKEQ